MIFKALQSWALYTLLGFLAVCMRGQHVALPQLLDKKADLPLDEDEQVAICGDGSVIPSPPRLPIDLSEGSLDLAWWRKVIKTREQRIEWWRNARFGCFIHWNASVIPAGKWDGINYLRYPEHFNLKPHS